MTTPKIPSLSAKKKNANGTWSPSAKSCCASIPATCRVATARTFNVWEGGGEYNVARGLRRCFGLKTAIVTALADNPVGRLVEDLMNQGGVDQSHVHWTKYDGVGRTTRNGLNFTERGFGVRAALGCSDRGHTAVSPAQARRHRLGRDLRQGRRALVPHRRHLLRALRNHPRGLQRGDGRRPQARHHHQLRPQLPRLALEVDRRQGQGHRGQPRTRVATSTS